MQTYLQHDLRRAQSECPNNNGKSHHLSEKHIHPHLRDESQLPRPSVLLKKRSAANVREAPAEQSRKSNQSSGVGEPGPHRSPDDTCDSKSISPLGGMRSFDEP